MRRAIWVALLRFTLPILRFSREIIPYSPTCMFLSTVPLWMAGHPLMHEGI